MILRSAVEVRFLEKITFPSHPRFDFTLFRSAREAGNKKNHGAEVHRGVKTQKMTVSGQQAHSEDVFGCGHDPSRSIGTWNALLSLGFSYLRSLHQERDSVKTNFKLSRLSRLPRRPLCNRMNSYEFHSLIESATNIMG
jgi:hypothetical protein